MDDYTKCRRLVEIRDEVRQEAQRAVSLIPMRQTQYAHYAAVAAAQGWDSLAVTLHALAEQLKGLAESNREAISAELADLDKRGC
jgi:rubrerythrin